MTRFTKFAVALAVMMSASPLVAQADDKDVIDYRQHIMKTLDEQVASIGMIVSTQVEPDNLVAHVQAIALTAQTALKSFEPKIQGGESKPEVWAMWPDFEKKMKDFAAGTAKLVEVAKTGGPNAVNEAMVDALTCKGCHDIYRTKK